MVPGTWHQYNIGTTTRLGLTAVRRLLTAESTAAAAAAAAAVPAQPLVSGIGVAVTGILRNMYTGIRRKTS